MKTTQDMLQVSKFIKAKREKVYEAWTQPEIMRRWGAPGDMRVTHLEADVRVGGSYRTTMSGDDGDFTTYGTYEEVVPNRKLVYTFGWEGPDRVETRVTVEFLDKDGGTEVVLTHERFVDPEEVKLHGEGWTGTLENLEKHFAGAKG